MCSLDYRIFLQEKPVPSLLSSQCCPGIHTQNFPSNLYLLLLLSILPNEIASEWSRDTLTVTSDKRMEQTPDFPHHYATQVT
jgi:hypothetical protein